MKKIIVCITLIFLFVTLSYAQTKTVKGNYCGKNIGNRAGFFGFRIGSEVQTFEMNFGQERNNAKMVRFDVSKLKVGDEFIIKYRPEEVNYTGFIVAITGTSKRKKIEPCTIE